MSDNFWEQRKLEIEQTRQAEVEKKAAEKKEKKAAEKKEQKEKQPKVDASAEPKKKKEKQPKVEQQKEQQQPNGAVVATVEQKEKKKKIFKKTKEAPQPSTSQPTNEATTATQDDFQTVERKTGGRRQFRGANKRNNNKKKENGEQKEKKKENKENKEQQPKKEEKTTSEQQPQQPVVQPAQIKVFSTTESTPVQGSDSWVSLLRGNQPESSTSTTTQQQATSSTNGTTTKKSKPKTEKKTVVVKPATAATTTEAKKPQKNYEAGKNLLRSTEVDVDQALLDEVGVFIQPRGMTNINNSCYMNAVLQTLVSLPQFYHVMKKLGKISLDSEEYPLTNKFVRLVNEYQTMKTHRPQSGKEGEKKERKYFINASTEHLVPSYIVDYIQQSSTNLEDAFLLGTQHDAHEFLNLILQRLHEELKKTETSLGRKSPSASKKKNKKTETSEQSTEQPAETTSEEWKEVGKKNKSTPMREHEMGDSSVVSRTFAGKMKSFVQKQGESKGSSVVEPFFSLHLPIKDESIKGVKFALREMTKEENVSDKNAKSSIYQLPKVLLLHLRRFDFSSTEGVQKISKRIRFDYELNIDEKVVPNVKAISGKPNLKYRLASVVCHHGKDATSGHYSTYIQHGCGKWIHIDDTKVTVVSLQHVLDQQAYILTYVQDENQEHYKLYSEGSSSSPLFSESNEQNGEKKKDHKKREKKEKKEKKSNTTAATNTTTTTTTTTETKTEAKTDV